MRTNHNNRYPLKKWKCFNHVIFIDITEVKPFSSMSAQNLNSRFYPQSKQSELHISLNILLGSGRGIPLPFTNMVGLGSSLSEIPTRMGKPLCFMLWCLGPVMFAMARSYPSLPRLPQASLVLARCARRCGSHFPSFPLPHAVPGFQRFNRARGRGSAHDWTSQKSLDFFFSATQGVVYMLIETHTKYMSSGVK